MSRIALMGYYGFNNAGDEAILFSTLRSLRQRDRSVEVTVLSANPEKTARLYDVAAADRWKIMSVLKTLWNSDMLVFGGGSILQDTTSTRSLDYYLWVARLALWMRKPVYFMGQGIGPVKAPRSRQKTAALLNRVTRITVRDRDSKQELLDMGVTGPEIEVTADLVLGIYHREIERAPGLKVLERNGIGAGFGEKLVGISVRDWRDLSEYKKVLARVGDQLTEAGCKVVFLPFHFPGDVSCGREVVRQMEADALVIRDEVSTIEMLGMVSRMDLIIGMRMHSLIMAAVMGVPAIGLSYDPKIDAAVSLTGQTDGGRVENLDSDFITSEALRILRDREAIAEAQEGIVSPLRTRARRNIELLLELLGGRL